jgi:SNF2 family DNA or RNA helicase
MSDTDTEESGPISTSIRYIPKRSPDADTSDLESSSSLESSFSRRPELRLYDFQRIGVETMQRIAKTPLYQPPPGSDPRALSFPGFLLGDEMGLGKTVQVSVFLAGFLDDKTKCALIVCPVAVVDVWVKTLASE